MLAVKHGQVLCVRRLLPVSATRASHRSALPPDGRAA
jgi:hypothetical protein